MSMSRRANQSAPVQGGASRGYLPALLNPPHAVERTPEYQARVYLYAQNYFTPAEMQDLMRLGMRFVPQEAELIKRNLRRKGDWDGDAHPSDTPMAWAEREALGIEAVAIPETLVTNPLAPGQVRARDNDLRPLPGRDEAGYANAGPVEVGMRMNPALDTRVRGIPQVNGVARTYTDTSFLRRTELFIASMFVFDAAHALLAHLHQQAISLTAHGVDADDRLLKQIVRNLRGYTFRRLLPVDDRDHRVGPAVRIGSNAAGNAVNGVVDARANNTLIQIRDPNDPKRTLRLRPVRPAVQPDGRDLSVEDFPEPFSTAELQQLRSQGWILRDNKYWAPVRIPQMLARFNTPAATLARPVSFAQYDKDVMARAMNSSVLDPSRFMGIYPVAFLTNTTLADDAVAARLIEHCNSATIDPMTFTWGMRRSVFMPLETDVADIAMYADLKTYDELHETLNAFSNGMYEGLAIRGLWEGYLRDKLSGLVTQVPVNQLRPFQNVVKKIEVPATGEGGGVRRTAGQEEVLRLWQKADDVLNLINRWFLMGGNFGDVTYDQYRNPGTDPKRIMGNNAAISSWGARALGMNRCGPGYEEVWFDADPDTNPNANPQEPFLPDRTGQLTVQNPLARVAKCAPIGRSAGRIPDTGPDVYIDGEAPAYGRQRRARRVARRHKSAR